MFGGITKPHGSLGMQIIKGNPDSSTIRGLYREANPFASNLHPIAKEWRLANYPKIIKELTKLAVIKGIIRATNTHLMTAYGSLFLTVIKADGKQIYMGLAGTKVVTDNGVAFIVDAFQNSVELELMNYHAIGTGITAENQTDSALVTELTTEYTGNVRATGAQGENGANQYETVGTNTLDEGTDIVLREHGIFNQAATGGGVLLDRTLFNAITLSSGDSLQSTYRLTVDANG
jgi:hypothetical protein